MYDIRILNPRNPLKDAVYYGVDVETADLIYSAWTAKHEIINHDVFGPSVFELWQAGDCLSSERYG